MHTQLDDAKYDNNKVRFWLDVAMHDNNKMQPEYNDASYNDIMVHP